MQTRGREINVGRSEEVRLTIELGALIVAAGLGRADRDFLRGVFAEAALIVPGSAEHGRLRIIGRAHDDRDLA